MSVIDLKQVKPKRATRDLVEIDKSSGAGRFMAKMVRDIQVDLGGKRQLSRIQLEWIEAFAGVAATLRYLNLQVALGESSELDLAAYSQCASTMLRIGRALGTQRRQRDVTPTLGHILRQGMQQHDDEVSQ